MEEAFQYIRAEDLDRAWLNFELDLPLEPQPDGSPNPFYVERPDNPAILLKRYLLRPYRQPPKYFFSGHRGCGKSTELRQLAVDAKIQAKYWPINFTIRDEADINDLDFKDVLLAIGGWLFRDYRQGGGKLPDQLLRELDSWRGQIEQQVSTVLAGRTTESEVAGELNAFFVRTGVKLKLEPKTRSELRQVFERNLSELIEVINNIAIAIQAQTKRIPLILVDDLDKPDLERVREIFCDHRETMLQPALPIVYTVPSSLFYSPDFEAIRDRTIFLSNVKLHPRGEPDVRFKPGYDTMQAFLLKRMQLGLIAEDTLDDAIQVSGGLFREMCRVMRTAIDWAVGNGHARVERTDVAKAEAEIRSEYRRFLTQEQRNVLRAIRNHNRYDEPEKIAPLLQVLAALEYKNDEVWCDVHPALNKLLDEAV